MGSIINWNGKLNVPKALQLDHDEARAEFVRARSEGGRIAEAGKRVAQLCLPHFEQEEERVFPVLALLPYLASNNLQPEMMDVMPLISELRAKHDAIVDHHQAILAAIDELLHAAYQQKNREFAEFAHNLRNHEDIEAEVIYPTIILIGNYLQEKFAH
jgi:hemerythrin superfamily protein